MDCLTCREALSARIDGETEPVPPSVTDEHLHGCAECRAWHTRAAELSRSLRVRAAVDVPDLTAAIMANAPVPVRGWGPRLALGGVAVAQLALALGQVFGVGAAVAHGGGGHLFNESTAWNLALGVGLFWAVFQRRAVAGLIPVLSGFLALLLVYSAYDLVAGVVPVSRVLGHGLLLAGLVLLVVIHRGHGDPAPRDGAATDSDRDSAPASAPEAPATPESAPGRRRPPLRPAGHHRAA